MAEKFSFFNSVLGDRKYKAEDWANYFNKLVTNGIFNGGENLKVRGTTPESYSVQVSSGSAWINGYLYQNEGVKNLTVDVADGVLNRKDIVILRLNLADRKMETILVKGAPSASPVAPSLIRTQSTYDLQLAEITVRKSAIAIKETDIVDTRLNTQKCGLVNSLIQADTTAIFDSFQAWYETKTAEYENDWAIFAEDAQIWIDALKNQIAEDDHTQINERIDTLETEVVKKLNIGDFGFGSEAVEYSGQDLNLLNKTSYVKGNNLGNAPTNAYYVIHHIEYNENTKFQTAYFSSGGKVTLFVRSYTTITGGWNTWEKLSKEGDFGLGGKSIDISYTSLDSLNKTGFYSGYLRDEPSGLPEELKTISKGRTVYCTHVEYRVDGWATQTIYTTETDLTLSFTRQKKNNVWSAWVKNHTTESTQSGREIVSGAANTHLMKRVVFKMPFVNIPTITTTFQTSIPNGFFVSVGQGAATQLTTFDLYVYKPNTGDAAVHWIATERTQ